MKGKSESLRKQKENLFFFPEIYGIKGKLYFIEILYLEIPLLLKKNEQGRIVQRGFVLILRSWGIKNHKMNQEATKTPKIKRKIRIIIRALSRTNSPCSGSASNTCKGNFFFPCYLSPYLCVFDYHFWYEHKYPHPKTSKPVSG